MPYTSGVSKQELMSAHTSKKLRLDLSRREEDAVIISNKVGEIIKCTGSKAKKYTTSLVVGKDTSLTEIPDYMSLDLVGIFKVKSIGEAAL